jgi:two-component sensor histidine kinase
MRLSWPRTLNLSWIGAVDRAPAAALALGIGTVLLAAALRLALSPLLGDGYAFVTFFLAVVAAAALGGVLSWVAALVSAVLISWSLFIPPTFSFRVEGRDTAVALVVFALNAGLSGLVAAVLRRALLRLTRAEQGQRLLINELNHRVKNTLATVQSLASQTARSAGDVAEFEQVFGERLQALSRAHNLLTEENWLGAELGDLIRQTLEAHEAEGGRISVDGPPIRLSPNAAVTVNLAIHELATNAAKYGALSVPGGRLDVRWRTEAGAAMSFVWRETGLQGLPPPTRQGFGSRLLKAVARELNAHVEPQHTPEGFAYHWRVPFSEKLQP